MPIFKPRNPLKASERPSGPIDLTIERLADDGRGIAFYQGKTVFVSGAMVGETAVVVFTKVTGKYYEAKVKSLKTTAVERVEPTCAVFDRCGGCSLQHMPQSQQLEHKQQVLLSQLARWQSLTPKKVLPPLVSSAYGYRRRVRLAVDYTKNGDVFMGFREQDSSRIVDLAQCPVMEAELELLLPALRRFLQSLKSGVVSHIEMLSTDSAVAVVIRHVRPLIVEQRLQLITLANDSLADKPVNVWFQGSKGEALQDARGDVNQAELTYELDNKVQLQFHPQDFIQSNKEVNAAMVRQAVELMAPAPDEHMADLFCGIGNFSVALAKLAGQVTSVEVVDTMVARAKANARRNHLSNMQCITMDLSTPSLKQLGKVDGILLDPPRAGAKEICERIGELLPPRIVYVSCDSSTFVRDAGILAETGYGLESAGIVDMYPQTAHSEVMGLFTL